MEFVVYYFKNTHEHCVLTTLQISKVQFIAIKLIY